MNIRFAAIFIWIALLPVLSACAYHGHVIDADTKLPIDGAVVVASWSEEQGSFTGGTSRLHDVKETLTDKNGDWSLTGPRGTSNNFLVSIYSILTLLTNTYYTNPPYFIIFKPGYCSIPNGLQIESCREKIKPQGERIGADQTVELPRLPSENQNQLDRLSNLPTYETGIGRHKSYKEIIQSQKEFIRLREEEKRAFLEFEGPLFSFSYWHTESNDEVKAMISIQKQIETFFQENKSFPKTIDELQSRYPSLSIIEAIFCDLLDLIRNWIQKTIVLQIMMVFL